jgi:hypothetical protein
VSKAAVAKAALAPKEKAAPVAGRRASAPKAVEAPKASKAVAPKAGAGKTGTAVGKTGAGKAGGKAGAAKAGAGKAAPKKVVEAKVTAEEQAKLDKEDEEDKKHQEAMAARSKEINDRLKQEVRRPQTRSSHCCGTILAPYWHIIGTKLALFCEFIDILLALNQ